MPQAWGTPDYLIALVIVLSMGVGLWRGLLKETLALLTWVFSVWGALHYGGVLAEHLGIIQAPGLRIIAAFLLLFIGIFAAGLLLRYILRAFIISTGLSPVDRVLGGGFGFLRGLMIASVAVFVVSLTAYEQQPAWQDSKLVPKFQPFAQWMLRFVPQEDQHEPSSLALLRAKLQDFSTKGAV